MPDLVHRLRVAHKTSQQRIAGSGIFEDAADEIERLRSDTVQQQADIELLKVRLENAEDDAARMRAAILWVCGDQPDAAGDWFGDHEPPKGKWPRPFWWRTPLRKLAFGNEQSGDGK